jgi:hypothetical protein
VDDAQDAAGDLEDGGVDQAAENAEQDMLARVVDAEMVERAKRHPQCDVARERLRKEGLTEQNAERAIEMCLTRQAGRLNTIPMLTEPTADWLRGWIIPPFVFFVPAKEAPATRPFLDGWV